VRQAVERALVVLGLEAEVALAHDDDGRELQEIHGADALDVALDERELLAGLCSGTEQNALMVLFVYVSMLSVQFKNKRSIFTFTAGERVDADDLHSAKQSALQHRHHCKNHSHVQPAVHGDVHMREPRHAEERVFCGRAMRGPRAPAPLREQRCNGARAQSRRVLPAAEH
jgi:hypothetical protein